MLHVCGGSLMRHAINGYLAEVLVCVAKRAQVVISRFRAQPWRPLVVVPCDKSSPVDVAHLWRQNTTRLAAKNKSPLSKSRERGEVD